MTVSKFLGVALGAMLAFAMVVPVAHASEQNQMTQLTIHAPFQIPGNKALTAGTYWFKLMDNAAVPRNVLEIYNASRSKVLATLITRPTYRAHETGRTELQFATSSRRPLTLVRWFYPGRFAGHTFIYSHQTERRINRENVENVFATPAPVVG
ncbi:MAG TPA: hypothetical protein VG322_08185 [Candidatus Acidoferrales bacterium]|jgi:hypothetical protein|nr:hypothetical protein [Candidatus Acidoferrales bacterium]